MAQKSLFPEPNVSFPLHYILKVLWNKIHKQNFPGPQYSPKLSYATYCPTSISSIETASHLSPHIPPLLQNTRTSTPVTEIAKKNPGPTAQSLNRSDIRSPPTLSRSCLAISEPKYPQTSESVPNTKVLTPLLLHITNPSLHKSAHRNVEPPVGAFHSRVRYCEYLATGTESNV